MVTSRANAGSIAVRQEAVVVLIVGGLALMTAVLYLWASRTSSVAEHPGLRPWWMYLAFVVANTLSVGFLWWHRRSPLRVFMTIQLVFVASALILGDAGNAGLTIPLWFSVYAVAAYAPIPIGIVTVMGGWFLSTVTKLVLAVRTGQSYGLPEIGLLSLDLGLFYFACFAVGLGMRLHRQRASDAAERARLVAENARAVSAELVATERNRLARDLHDLAAHDVMDVLLSVRARRVSSEDPVLAEIEEKIARALDNMRGVVRTLREEEAEGPVLEPLPDAAQQLIDSLIAQRGLSMDSHIKVDCHVADATALTTLSVLKEALLNADSHAPGQPVTVNLHGDGTGVRLTVKNPIGTGVTDVQPAHEPYLGGTGYGLLGAAERVGLLGGEFSAAASGEGEWVVQLHLPARPHVVLPKGSS